MHAVAESFDRSDHLVTQDGGQLASQPTRGERAVPGVHVGPTYVGAQHPDQDLSWTDLGQGDSLEGEG
ncbi:hypothetical protein MCHLDSM_00643 [Mycolicibacterium chlorophenolicum]|uniref:Uncharacterized protein n=1 Tax=Mycolicibacterium chlorophenolicum TaxID=37916 RepID=A0A0J6WL58_9MYCO|nr:hypothetical protein MCHLDSM_00643 [Mycolicibacterium chlorophenolicum]